MNEHSPYGIPKPRNGSTLFRNLFGRPATSSSKATSLRSLLEDETPLDEYYADQESQGPGSYGPDLTKGQKVINGITAILEGLGGYKGNVSPFMRKFYPFSPGSPNGERNISQIGNGQEDLIPYPTFPPPWRGIRDISQIPTPERLFRTLR